MTSETPRGRVAVVGDVGGHAAELSAALIALGADPVSLRLPADLTVVQVGDLVHRGPESLRVLDIVQGRLDDQPGQWVQLAGNHEEYYLLDTPPFTWHEQLPDAAVAGLRTWWATGQMRVAAAVRSHGPGSGVEGAEDLLVTHAGLTQLAWCRLGSPATAGRAAGALNRWGRGNDPRLHQTGAMISGRHPNFGAGPFWAHCSVEVYASWLVHAVDDGGRVPFGQVHGHTGPFRWQGSGWVAPPRVRPLLSADTAARHTTFALAGRRFIGVDPDHGTAPARRWAPLVLTDAEVLPT